MCQPERTEKPPEAAPLTVWQALALGLTEGLTEYLPVSSTGHLCLVERLLGIGATEEGKSAADAYAIAIQLGAIIAVLWLCWGRVVLVLKGVVGRSPEGRRLLLNLLIAFAPAVVVGLLAEPYIKRYLFGLWPITAAWLVGGAAILLFSRRRRESGEGRGIDELRPAQALVIGSAQVVAMWPGVSRSLVTILGGLAVGLSAPAAVEFSFLLGLVTLGAATCKEIATNGQLMVATFGYLGPLVGLVAALISAAIAVKWMVAYVTKHGLAVFGYYRIGLAVVVGVWLLLGS
jgi:undecaprenyl-diphosphatase